MRVTSEVTETDASGTTTKVIRTKVPITPNCVDDLETRVQGVADLYDPSAVLLATVSPLVSGKLLLLAVCAALLRLAGSLLRLAGSCFWCLCSSSVHFGTEEICSQI